MVSEAQKFPCTHADTLHGDILSSSGNIRTLDFHSKHLCCTSKDPWQENFTNGIGIEDKHFISQIKQFLRIWINRETYKGLGGWRVSLHRLTLLINQELREIPFDKAENTNATHQKTGKKTITWHESPEYMLIWSYVPNERVRFFFEILHESLLGTQSETSQDKRFAQTYSPKVPPCLCFRYFHKGSAAFPLTSILANRSNLAPYFSVANFLISSFVPGSWAKITQHETTPGKFMKIFSNSFALQFCVRNPCFFSFLGSRSTDQVAIVKKFWTSAAKLATSKWWQKQHCLEKMQTWLANWLQGKASILKPFSAASLSCRACSCL